MPRTSAIGSAGFTLLELMVVLAIMVLVSAAIPLAFSSRALQARRTAAGVERLIAALRQVEAYSAAYGIPARITVQERVLRVVFGVMGQGTADEAASQSYPVEVSVSALTEDGRPAGSLTIFPDGSASGGRFEVGQSPRQTTVWISPVTGRISTQASP